MNTSLAITEHVHQMRLELPVRWAHPKWIASVMLDPQMDEQLLRLRGRYAYAMPGVEIQ